MSSKPFKELGTGFEASWTVTSHPALGRRCGPSGNVSPRCITAMRLGSHGGSTDLDG